MDFNKLKEAIKAFFDSDPHFTVSFNTAAEHKGYDFAAVVEFSDQKVRAEFPFGCGLIREGVGSIFCE